MLSVNCPLAPVFGQCILPIKNRNCSKEQLGLFSKFVVYLFKYQPPFSSKVAKIKKTIRVGEHQLHVVTEQGNYYCGKVICFSIEIKNFYQMALSAVSHLRIYLISLLKGFLFSVGVKVFNVIED